MPSRRLTRFKILKAWACFGFVALASLLIWCVLAYQANDAARAALESNRDVQVTVQDHVCKFEPKVTIASSRGLLFFPGALIQPTAYAPLAQAFARQGLPVLIVSAPRRGVLGGAESTLVLTRARQAMQQMPAIQEWIVAGHSRGGAIASRMVKEDPSAIGGLLLLGTSHPRTLDLSSLSIPVLKILADRDGLAEPDKSSATRKLLPPSAQIHVIRGGNHSQFGSYGFQPGDRLAHIPRKEQQTQITEMTLEWLRQLPQPIPRKAKEAGTTFRPPHS